MQGTRVEVEEHFQSKDMEQRREAVQALMERYLRSVWEQLDQAG